MLRLARCRRTIAVAMVALALFFSTPVRPALAALVATEAVSNADAGEMRAALASFVEREDVVRGLRAMGVDPAEVQLRVQSLSDTEVRELAARLPDLPAGGMASITPPWYLIVIPIVIVVVVLGLLIYLGIWAGKKIEENRVASGEPPMEVKPRGPAGSPYPSNVQQPESVSVDAKEPWSGKWRITGGHLGGIWALKQDGDRVSSVLGSSYSLDATVSGTTLTGRWSEVGLSRGGPFTATVSEDGLSFSGKAGAPLTYFKAVKIE